MKGIIKLVTPKHILSRLNKKTSEKSKFIKSSSSSVSKSSPPSFGSSTSSSDSSDASHHHRSITRTTSDIKPGTTHHFSFDVVQAFKMMDRDGDGKITHPELLSLFSFLGGKKITEEELVDMIKEIDSDGDGCINLEELKNAVGSVFETRVRIGEDEDDLRGAFEFFDTNHDGKISAEELYQGFIKLGDDNCSLQDCLTMIQGVDVNKDGFVCFQDFSRMMLMDTIPT